MDHSTLPHHHQEMMGSDESLESMLAHTTKAGNEGQGQIIQVQGQDQKKPKPPDQVQKCPRCDSTNTKFCYYNNYSLSQPRYFCKSCRRYWTKGGTLRNVPVGGGCRKNRRSSSSSSSSSSRRCTPDHHHLMIASSSSSASASSPPHLLSTFENLHPHHAHALSTNDLSLAFARLHKQGGGGGAGFDNHGNISLVGNSHFDLFGNSFVDPQHLYYGGLGGNSNNNNNINTHEDHDQHHQRMAAMPFDHQHYQQEMMSNPSSGTSTPTTIKQEMGENNKVLWGLPWHISNNNGGGGGEGNYMNAAASVVAAAAAGGGGNNEFGDSLKDSWNHVGVLNPTNWHSLLNSPLM